MLRAGGNAFDAALAAMLTTFVAEPALTSLGGGGFMTAVLPNKKPFTLDFFVQTPLRKQRMEDVDIDESVIDFGTTKQPQFIGKGTVATPGCPAGVAYIHKHFCTLPLPVIAEPAIQLARRGCALTPYQQYTFDIIGAVLMYSPESRQIFGKADIFSGDRALKAGEICRNPRFADTLEHLCRYGFEDFYTGEIAHVFADDSRENGGSVLLEDLKSFSAIVREPLLLAMGEHTFATNPPPSAGGSLIAHGLKQWALDTKGKKILPYEGTAYVDKLVKVIREMDRFRREGINPLGNTTHFSVMDTAGNAVGITTSQGGVSGVCVPDTGISLNNMLGELDLSPDGLYSWKENERVSSMMSPSLILRDNKPEFVLGTGGSSRIRTAILQTVLNLLVHKMDCAGAVNHPRLHFQGDTLNIEPGLAPVDEALMRMAGEVIPWNAPNMYFGGVHIAARLGGNTLVAAADSRRDGAVDGV